jgi:hypothetical protein
MEYPKIIEDIVNSAKENSYHKSKQAIMDLNRNGWDAEIGLDGNLTDIRPIYLTIEIPYKEDDFSGVMCVDKEKLFDKLNETISNIDKIL